MLHKSKVYDSKDFQMAFITNAKDAIANARRYIMSREDRDRGSAQVDDKAIADIYDLLSASAATAAPPIKARIEALLIRK